MEKNNLILRVLEYATQQTEFTFQQLCEAIKLDDKEKEQLRLLIHHKELLYHDKGDFYNSSKRTNGNLEIFASAEDHFKLLEYQELKEARESSKSAMKVALFAISISILSTAISAYFSYRSLDSYINIPPELYSQLASLDKKATTLTHQSIKIEENTQNLNSNIEQIKQALPINSLPPVGTYD